eukprot:358812-Chlamydomonas_euryale.AAC.1
MRLMHACGLSGCSDCNGALLMQPPSRCCCCCCCRGCSPNEAADAPPPSANECIAACRATPSNDGRWGARATLMCGAPVRGWKPLASAKAVHCAM